MSERRALPPEFHDSPFSVRHALDAGMSTGRIRALDLESPFHGIRRLDHPEEPDTDDSLELERRRLATLVRQCQSFMVREGRPVVFSHVTAARLYRMPLPWALETRTELDVSALTPAHAPQGAGVVGHRLRAGSITVGELAGIPVPSALDVWVQLAPLMSVDSLIVAGDGLVRRKHPLASIGQIQVRVAALRRQRGVKRLRAAVPDLRSGTDSAAETRTRLIIVRGGLPEPVIGHTVHNADGFFVGTPDLAYVEEKIALDYEGDIHRTDARTFAEDIERREQFQDADWRHIRVVKDHLDRPHRLIDRVGFALAERRAS